MFGLRQTYVVRCEKRGLSRSCLDVFAMRCAQGVLLPTFLYFGEVFDPLPPRSSGKVKVSTPDFWTPKTTPPALDDDVSRVFLYRGYVVDDPLAGRQVSLFELNLASICASRVGSLAVNVPCRLKLIGL